MKNTCIICDIIEMNTTCCICLLDIEDKQSHSVMVCNHVFHTLCIRQYGGTDCPLCRRSLHVKQNICHNISIDTYPEYVWIFGSFINSRFTERKNYLVFNNMKSGYFWRLFDEDTMKTLEDALCEKNKPPFIDTSSTSGGMVSGSGSRSGGDTHDSDSDNSSDISDVITDSDDDDNSNNRDTTKISIGMQTYIIKFDVHVTYHFEFQISNVGTQTNMHGKNRPIMRVKWSDALKYLMVVGVHDNMFFKNIFVYCDENNKFKLLNMKNQQILNDYHGGNVSMNGEDIDLDGEKYTFDKTTNTLIQPNTSIKICEFSKQKVVNY